MDTKLKGFTNRLPVKIICFALAVLAALGTVRASFQVAMYYSKTDVLPDIIFADAQSAQTFYDQNMYRALYSIENLIHFESEERILSGEFIFWQEYKYEYEYEYEHDAWLNADMVSSVYLPAESDTPEQRQKLEESAIRAQLAYFQNTQRYLDAIEGLYYYAETPGAIFGNAAKNASAFTDLPVYSIYNDGSVIESSHYYSHGGYYDMYGSALNTEILLGFSAEVVNDYIAKSAQAQREYTSFLSVIAVSTALFLVCLFVLMLGAGRRAQDGKSKVYLTGLDMLYLDISFIISGSAITLVILGAVSAAAEFYRNGREQSALQISLVATAVAAVLLLGWSCTFAKRIKDKSALRHTLAGWMLRKIKRTLVAIFGKLLGFAKSLWAGAALTVRVLIISVFVALVLVVAVALAASIWSGGFLVFLYCLFVIVGVTVLLLLFAKRLHTLEEGARAAAGGEYKVPIIVGGGALGSIADSINNISEGINAAVDERMKSERMRTELITNVSHDIRTPLTSIITYTDLLKNEGLGCARAPEYLEVLVSKSQRLKTLTDELFEAAKAASGSVEVNLLPMNLSDLVHQVLGEADERVKTSGLDFRIDLPERAMVLGDGKLLWRVMENLLSNVFKYSLAGSRIYIDIIEEADFVRLDMKNISREALNIDPEELTERFKRGDASRSSEGSGLGLSIVQSFTMAQGGKFMPSIDGDLFKASVLLPKAK